MGPFQKLRTLTCDFGRRIAPDLFDGSLYVLHAHEIGLRNDPAVLGFYRGDLASMYQTDLEARGLWHGDGPAVVIDTRNLLRSIPRNASCSRRARACRRHDVATSYAGTVFHEAVHCLLDDTRDYGLFLGKVFPGGINSRASLEPSYPRPGAPPWECHGLQFIRLCAHIAARAAFMGLQPLDVVDTGSYGLSITSSYCEALGREPERLARHSLRSIRDTDPPEAFTALWQRDTQPLPFGDASHVANAH